MRILKTRLFAVILVLVLLFSRSAWETKAPLIPAVLFLAGLHLGAIAALGRLWCSLYIAGHKDATLIQQGPYSLCRNPLYFFSFLGAIGVGMATGTFTVPVLLAVSFLLYYPSVIGKEEAKLREMFPGQFDDYCARVPRFFPKRLNFVEPDSCVVNPVTFRKHIMSALWFVWIIGWLGFVVQLHGWGLIPVFFRLY
jgi:protein-S-isoprenylcysteine O-methyltransferase Ste14